MLQVHHIHTFLLNWVKSINDGFYEYLLNFYNIHGKILSLYILNILCMSTLEFLLYNEHRHIYLEEKFFLNRLKLHLMFDNFH